MLINPRILNLLFQVNPRGILHIGAHEGEEYEMYRKAGWLTEGKIIWVEAQPDLAHKLQILEPWQNSRVISAAAWDIDDLELDLNIASNSQSSSVFKFGSHSKNYPWIHYKESIKVKTVRLDTILSPGDFNFIALDIQGAELKALKGLGNLLGSVKWIYTECNNEEVYVGIPRVGDIDEYLKSFGFKRIATRWVPRAGWGDALYCNYKDITAKEKIYITNGRLVFMFIDFYSKARWFSSISANMAKKLLIIK